MTRDPSVEKIFRLAHAMEKESGKELAVEYDEIECALRHWRGHELPAEVA